MRNLLTDVEGIAVGHAADEQARTGVSLIIPDKPAIAAVACMGGGPGTRETDALKPENLVHHIDGLVLAGGSVYGLEAASELTLIMGQAGRGFPTGAALPSPIIPAAILFDMNNCPANQEAKQWSLDNPPPYRALTHKAYAACGTNYELGNVGAGYGAQAGNRKGGLGSASSLCDDIIVSAMVAVNSLGSVCDGLGNFYASYLAQEGDGLPNTPPKNVSADPMANSKLAFSKTETPDLNNTSIGVVATDADLTRAEALRVAMMAQDGLARAIRPIHTPFDGDTLFVLATGQKPLVPKGVAPTSKQRSLALAKLGAYAADCVSRSIMRGVHLAQDLQ